MGISRPLWSKACLAMGRECAAVAVGLVSAKPAEHFRTSPGGYFHGMVAKARASEFNLRTIWGFRQAKATKSCGPLVRTGGPYSPPAFPHQTGAISRHNAEAPRRVVGAH